MLKFTVSIGVATHTDRKFASASELEVAADRYLLKAKTDGRNCVRSSRNQP